MGRRGLRCSVVTQEDMAWQYESIWAGVLAGLQEGLGIVLMEMIFELAVMCFRDGQDHLEIRRDSGAGGPKSSSGDTKMPILRDAYNTCLDSACCFASHV